MQFAVRRRFDIFLEQKINNRLVLFGFFSTYCLAIFTLQIDTDIRVYKEAYNQYLYLSDTGFEFLQIIFKAINFPFESLQVSLLILSIILAVQLRNTLNSVIYLIGPIVFIGVFNSIRQSFAVTFLFLAIEIYKFAQKKSGLRLLSNISISFIFLILAISFHKGAAFVLLFYFGVNLTRIFLRRKLRKIELTIFTLLVSLILVNTSWIYSILVRYSVYLDINISPDRGIISQLKIYFWWLSLVVDYYFSQLKSTKKTEMNSFLIFKFFFLATITLVSYLGEISPELVSRILLLFMYFSFWHIMSNRIIISRIYHLIYVLSPSSIGLALAIL